MTNTNTNINADDSLPQFAKMIDRVGGDHKNYQYEGVRWCRQNEQDGRGGGLVADEMGLGKTLTMIGLLIENFKRRTLIVVPVALIDQWRDQIHRFTGHSPVVFHGKGRKVDPAVLLSAPVVLTTYATLKPPSTAGRPRYAHPSDGSSPAPRSRTKRKTSSHSPPWWASRAKSSSAPTASVGTAEECSGAQKTTSG